MIFDTQLINNKTLYAASFNVGVTTEVFIKGFLPPTFRVASIHVGKQDAYLTDNLEILHSVIKHYALEGVVYYKLIKKTFVPLVGSREDASSINVDTKQLRYF